MANAPTPSDLIAERIGDLCKRSGVTLAELAKRCDATGVRLTAQALYKLVGQRDKRTPRPVSIDELLALAYVLDIAPVHLIAGLDDEAPFPVTPSLSVPSVSAREWIRGFRRLPDGSEIYRANVPPGEVGARFFAVRDVPTARQAIASLSHLVDALDEVDALTEADDGSR
jgi:transcriptional regulator with XRE-family HTH domain